MSILGLHHVTATVDDAQDDLDFCIGALGLRLVKKTVNFDNHHVYHFYYGDETGALAWWRVRLGTRGIAVTDVEPRFGDAAIRFSDRSGLTFELIAADGDARTPWIADEVEPAAAIRGLHSVTLVVRDASRTIELMTGLLGFKVMDKDGHRIRVAAADGGGPGKTIDVAQLPDSAQAVNGLGTVHHVAMAVATDSEQLALREELIRYGCRVTEVRDRCYFKSFYFREPGGVLFEVATVEPGFTLDEDARHLGHDLKLPPWEE